MSSTPAAAHRYFQLIEQNSWTIIELLLPDVLDPVEFDRLNESVLRTIEGKSQGQWLLDLALVNHMGSSALGMLVNIRHRVKVTGGRLVVCGMNPRLRELFRTCSMDRLFTVVRTRNEVVG
jgi:anti-anti-sigma factor